MTRSNTYSGMRVLIMGLGLNGGNLEAAVYLGKKGAGLCITDLRDETILAPSLIALEKRLPGVPIRYVLGTHETRDFENADLVIKNPGVPPDSPFLKKARRVETDISLFLETSPARLIAVTGSKGKSSVASSLHWVLNAWAASPASGKKGGAFLAGNITLSPLAYLDELTAEDDIILELSSWQLGDIKGRTKRETGAPLLKPRAAIISSIIPDHLDRYGTMEAYIADKRIIYQGLDKKDVTVTENDAWGASFRAESRARNLVYSETPLPEGIAGGWQDKTGAGVARLSPKGALKTIVPANLPVPGSHQKKNLLASSLALLDLGIPADFILEHMGTFPGLSHRLEFFHERSGVRFYNDSAATVPEAAAAAIRAFDRAPIIIAGGADKKLDFTPLVNAAKEAARLILLEGSGTSRLAPLLKEAGVSYSGPFASLENALAAALEHAGSGSVIVLSPGCASFGMFVNEFDRGNQWKSVVARLVP